MVALLMQVQQQQGFRPYFASPVTTPILIDSCKSFVATAPTVEANFCTGYILATYDQLTASHQICPRSAIGPVQIVSIATKYLRDNPRMWNRHPNALLKAAFSEDVLPCR
jgi:hypothetical protein